MGIDARILVRVPRPVDDAECRRVGRSLCFMFGRSKFFFGWDKHNPHEHAISVIDDYAQDGPTIRPEPGETLLQVSVWTSYYGAGYERGDLPFLYVLARALERLTPGCAVWYGGDSSGVLAEPFDQAAREKLMEHFLEVGHEPYYQPNPYMTPDRFDAEKPVCSLCEAPMQRNGYGRDYAAFSCPCGERLVFRDGVSKRTTESERREAKNKIDRQMHEEFFKNHPDMLEQYRSVED